jgi:RNA polymerase sigma-70 factor, ECF subfamily
MKTPAGIEAALSRETIPPHGGEANSLRDVDELIEAARAGDRMALNRLLADARPRLLAVALRMVRDRDDAEDVVQEALLKVCRNLTRFEGRAAFSTWLHRIVVNAALDRLRRPHHRRERGADADEPDTRPAPEAAVDEETPERIVARAETGAAVHGALARLSPVHQHVLALRELHGESYQSIARAARCPVGTVMSRLHHARRRLADELAPVALAA